LKNAKCKLKEHKMPYGVSFLPLYRVARGKRNIEIAKGIGQRAEERPQGAWGREQREIRRALQSAKKYIGEEGMGKRKIGRIKEERERAESEMMEELFYLTIG